MVSKSAVIGIDLGSSESCVAYVGKGLVDIVQNEVSKRNTSTLVGFTSRERLLGDAALAQIKSNAKNTCRNFKHLLGQRADAPEVQKEKFWSTSEIVDAYDGYAGYDVTYKGEQRVMSAPQVAAMFLTKLRETTETWCDAKVCDVVIGVPSYYSDIHRQALLDAAKIANVSVLRLINEYTATALAYGIYRSNDFDLEKPCTVAFCSMGHSMFSVSIVQFVRGKLHVLTEASDKVGGRDMDECLMREFASQFKKKTGCDPLSNKKAAFKLEDAVTKTKKVLSSNYEAPITCECLMEDEDFASQITRVDFEAMCSPMMKRVQDVLDKAKAAANVPLDQIDFVEMVGGASRVPWLKNMCSEAFGGKALSTTMNADESVARGCALQAAMLSPLYKVRDFKVEDSSPYSITVGWMGSALDAEAKEEDDGDTKMEAAEGEYKTATVFPAFSPMNTLKMLTFYRKGPFDLKVGYADIGMLVAGTPADLGSYKIELPSSTDVKKVKVKAKLSISGIFTVDGAQVIEEEEYEETSKEKRELPPSPAPETVPAAETAPKGEEKPEGEAKEGEGKDGEAKEAPKPAAPPEKKYEWVEVKKMKKRIKKTDLVVTTTGKPGLSVNDAQARMDEESAMQADMRDIIETDEKRNDLESYIFTTRDKISSSGAWNAFITDADRDKFESNLMEAEDWLYDNPDATKVQYVEKRDALKAQGDGAEWRCNEDKMRVEWISAVEGTITNYRTVAEAPADKYSHIAPEKLAKITQACDELRKWLDAGKAKQATMGKTEKPHLLCAEMDKRNKELAKMADDVLKEPKPAPLKEEEKKEEDNKKEGEATGAPEAEKMDVDID